MARLSKEEAVALFEAAIAAGEYPKELEQCPHCQEPLPIDLLGYKVAEARGVAEAASLCTQFAVMLPAEATEARQAALDLATAILANAGCLPGAEIKVEQAGPETRSWVQALTAKWPAGDPGEGHSGFCQHHLTGECAAGCTYEVERTIRTKQCGNCNGAGCPDCHFGEVEVPDALTPRTPEELAKFPLLSDDDIRQAVEQGERDAALSRKGGG